MGREAQVTSAKAATRQVRYQDAPIAEIESAKQNSVDSRLLLLLRNAVVEPDLVRCRQVRTNFVCRRDESINVEP